MAPKGRSLSARKSPASCASTRTQLDITTLSCLTASHGVSVTAASAAQGSGVPACVCCVCHAATATRQDPSNLSSNMPARVLVAGPHISQWRCNNQHAGGSLGAQFLCPTTAEPAREIAQTGRQIVIKA